MLRPTNAARLLPLALILAFSACSKKEAPPADTAVVAAPAPVVDTVLKVTEVETGKGINTDKTVKDDAHDFGVRDTVYVSVKTEGNGSGKLAAKWTFKNGQAVSESSQDITSTGASNHEFHITKKSAWPKGDYRVVIRLNGDSVGTKDFTVK